MRDAYMVIIVLIGLCLYLLDKSTLPLTQRIFILIILCFVGIIAAAQILKKQGLFKNASSKYIFYTAIGLSTAVALYFFIQ